MLKGIEKIWRKSEGELTKQLYSQNLTNLCWEGDLDTTLQDVVSGDFNRTGQLQVLHDQV